MFPIIPSSWSTSSLSATIWSLSTTRNQISQMTTSPLIFVQYRHRVRPALRGREHVEDHPVEGDAGRVPGVGGDTQRLG